ncbi:MAG: hypothetical protein LBQ81_07435 [Zoogloeaceae bacterium]|jgi:hypothetical protein|nr:hypothetical protein [Zoogloeaceae bacterium]
MRVKKAGLLFASLLALSGCGQEEVAETDAQQAEVTKATHAGNAGPDAPAAEDDTARSNAETALAGRAEYMRGMLVGCINHEYPELDKVKRQQFCDCFHTATYARMTDAEWVEWDAVMVEKGKIWGAGFEKVFAIANDNKSEPEAPDPVIKERIARFDAIWRARYTRNEDACMKRLGVTVQHTDQP